MAITYPLTPPVLPGFREFSWSRQSAVVVQKKEFTFGSKVYAWPGQLRTATARLGFMTHLMKDQIAEWEAFILKLNEQEGTFYLQDPVTFANRGNYVSGSPKVAGDDQNGSSLVTDGWPAGMANMLRKADWISINGRLYNILDDVTSSGGGTATLTIWPHVNYDVEDNADILVGSAAKGIFRLLESPRFDWNEEHARDGFAFSCEEAFE